MSDKPTKEEILKAITDGIENVVCWPYNEDILNIIEANMKMIPQVCHTSGRKKLYRVDCALQYNIITKTQLRKAKANV